MTYPEEHPEPNPPRGMADPAYRSKRRAQQPPMNFELSNDLRAQLRQIAEHRNISMSAVLRQLIATAYRMDIRTEPHCVSGRTCLAPHLFPPPQPRDTEPKAP